MISFGRKHCKYDMHIYFHASFLGTAFKSFIDDKDYTAQSVRTIGSLYVSINHNSQYVLCFYIISYLCVVHEEARYFIFLKKAVLILDFTSLIHLYVYIHIALCYQEFYLQGSCNDLAMPHTV